MVQVSFVELMVRDEQARLRHVIERLQAEADDSGWYDHEEESYHVDNTEQSCLHIQDAWFAPTLRSDDRLWS